MEENRVEMTVNVTGTRLDVFLSGEMGITRSFAQRLIKKGFVAGEGRLKPSSRVQAGETYAVALPETEGPNLELEPEPVDFKVVYEDTDLIVINKPAGLVVHPAPGHWRGTLVHGLLWHYPEMAHLRNRLRPGIVHRLDATTSGLMVVARRQSVMEALQKMFQERQVTKQYLALVHGTPAKLEGTLSGPMARDPNNPLRMAVIDGGRPALTGYRVLWSRPAHRDSCRGGMSLIICSLFTGRTHQIRVHLAAMGHPLAGDTLYGAPEDDNLIGRVFLHSWRLAFRHPATGFPLTFCLPLPEELKTYLVDKFHSAR